MLIVPTCDVCSGMLCFPIAIVVEEPVCQTCHPELFPEPTELQRAEAAVRMATRNSQYAWEAWQAREDERRRAIEALVKLKDKK